MLETKTNIFVSYTICDNFLAFCIMLYPDWTESVVLFRDALISKKCSFFEHCSKEGGGVNPCSKIMSEIVVCSGGHLTTWNLHERGLLRHLWWNLRRGTFSSLRNFEERFAMIAHTCDVTFLICKIRLIFFRASFWHF